MMNAKVDLMVTQPQQIDAGAPNTFGVKRIPTRAGQTIGSASTIGGRKQRINRRSAHGIPA